MKFFAVRNLTEQALAPSLPWEFQTTETITEQIRHDKEERQNWYRNIATRHSFYTAIEPANSNQRASRKDNPPRLLYGFVADYDTATALSAALARLSDFPVKPAWIEQSLGGGVRLVWILPRALPVESYEFACAILQTAVSWLKLKQLPAFDEAAFEDPTRLYCNGGIWLETGHGPISEETLQLFFVKAAKKFRFGAEDDVLIPLEKVQAALAAKYPGFCWEADFAVETSGPSFWIPGSQSSNSAILKTNGFYTFSAHADKVFYTWEDLLGAEFVKQFKDAALSKATGDLWYDGRKFWRKKKGFYVGMEREELHNYLSVDCGINPKGTQMAAAYSHIYNENYIENASPYLFYPPGLLVYQGKRRLNTAQCDIVQPATGTQMWGAHGSFPFLSLLLDNVFTSAVQRDHVLAWHQYFYESGLNSTPSPGPVLFFMGGVGTGKTLLSRHVIGKSVGGYVDASSYLIRGSEFNHHMFEVALWALDDDTTSDNPAAAANVQAMMKKSVANSSFLLNKKFQNAGMVDWMGRIIATTNLDYMSSRMLGPLDSGNHDKVSVFRCQKTSQIKFPARVEMLPTIERELPFYLRWLLDHTPPDHVLRDSRWGYAAWQESSLMDQASQTSKAAPFKEILLETLEEFFRDAPEAMEWRGTVSKLIQQLHANPLHECVIRTLRLEQVSRYLEAVEKDGALNCRVETGSLNCRLWIFPRPANLTPAPKAAASGVNQSNSGIFLK